MTVIRTLTSCPTGSTSTVSAQLVVPYSLTNNDVQFVRGNAATGAQFADFVSDAIEQLVEEGSDHPRMMSVGLHGRVSGHPARARALSRLLGALARRDDVWVARREDIAKHWREHHSPAGVPD